MRHETESVWLGGTVNFWKPCALAVKLVSAVYHKANAFETVVQICSCGLFCSTCGAHYALQAGLGKLDEMALERSGGGAQSLLNAQAAAKAAKAGLWSIEPKTSGKQVKH